MLRCVLSPKVLVIRGEEVQPQTAAAFSLLLTQLLIYEHSERLRRSEGFSHSTSRSPGSSESRSVKKNPRQLVGRSGSDANKFLCL